MPSKKILWDIPAGKTFQRRQRCALDRVCPHTSWVSPIKSPASWVLACQAHWPLPRCAQADPKLKYPSVTVKMSQAQDEQRLDRHWECSEGQPRKRPWSFSVYAQGVGRQLLKRGQTHILSCCLFSYFPDPETRSQQFSGSSRAAALLGAVKHSPRCFWYTPRLLKSGQITEGWDVIPNLPRAGAECGHLAKAAPAPQCPVSVASRIHAVGEMNHLLPWPGQQLIVYVKATLLGRSLPPHPSYAVISAQQQPLGSTNGHSWGPESPAQRRMEGRLLSCPLAALLPTQRKGSVSKEEVGL